MKILFVNHTLDYYAGTETFTYALAIELQRQGHVPVCFSQKLGPIAERLREKGVSVTNDLATLDDSIDVIHGHHRYESLLAYARFPDKPMIWVCHGILPWQEQPIKAKLNIFHFVAVSEEVKEHLVESQFIAPNEIAIIRNAVDLKRFCCHQPIHATPRRAIILSNDRPEERSVIRRACNKLGIDLTIVGGSESATWNVEDCINQADIVFSLGRGALESMACKRVVIVDGSNGADGLVTPDNFRLFRGKNFSGRTNNLKYSADDLSKEIEKYQPSLAEDIFEYIYKDHNIETVAQKYLELYDTAVKHRARKLEPTATSLPYQALEQVVKEAKSFRDELELLRADNARLQRFSDAVRNTWIYRAYRTLIKLFGFQS